ncbi:MAG: hypothetical protein LBI77_01055 [Puniceicoccales bacterium]|jgi:myb proto-oncogene protein|nr:hypothetical protein [Puniceicoccales bacterium]
MNQNYIKNRLVILWGLFLIFAASAAYASSESDGHTTGSKKKYQRWNLEEDRLLGDAVNRYGPKNWNQIASQVPNRTSRQCRDRWIEQLDPKVKHGNWTKEEDDFIIAFVEKNGHEWSQCAEKFPNRTDNSIENRWYSNLSKRQKKGAKKKNSKFILDLDYIPSDEETFEFISNDQHSEKLSTGNVDEKNPSFPRKRTKKYWQEEEDNLLRNVVEQNGPQNWNQIAAQVPGRTAKQCRERWIEYLDPTVKHGDWTEGEDQLLIEQRQLLGNKWAKIARNFPNRRGNEIKNRWYIHLSKKIIQIHK